eukprot:gene10551-7324_t
MFDPNSYLMTGLTLTLTMLVRLLRLSSFYAHIKREKSARCDEKLLQDISHHPFLSLPPSLLL